MWVAFRTGIFTKFFFQLKNFDNKETTKKNEKVKHMKESIMSNEIANQDFANIVKNAKSSEEAMEVVKEMEKLLEVISALFYGLPTNKVKYLKDLD